MVIDPLAVVFIERRIGVSERCWIDGVKQGPAIYRYSGLQAGHADVWRACQS